VRLCATLARLAALPERPAVIVVDNASADGTAEAISDEHPDVMLVRLERYAGAHARTVGAAAVATPYVAFSDDDSWWAPGALARAADLLDAHAGVALLAARVVLGPDERIDPMCERMLKSPLGTLAGAWPFVLGFIACGAVVRRAPFLDVGGFREPCRIGGEEELVALDLASRGWLLVYVHEVIAHHHPSALRNRTARRRDLLRNRLRTAWPRRPIGSALRETCCVVRRGIREQEARGALVNVALESPRLAGGRRVVPQDVELQLARLAEGGS
jgi:GT2 family glycosyltransferase